MNSRRWREDLTFLTKTIEKAHPNPYTHITRKAFRQEADSIKANLATLTDAQIIVKLMELVASLQDGHTTLKPVDPNGFDWWYPVRFYWFSDGIFVTAAGPEEKTLIGCQVLKIGNRTAEEAGQITASLQGADNEFARSERIQYLSNATILHSLGISPSPRSLELQIRLPDGTQQSYGLSARQTEFGNDDWMYWGEMYGPPGMKIVSSLQYLESDEFRKEHPFLPLHVRCRKPFFSVYLEDSHSVYMQFNFVQDYRGEKFADFHQNLFSWIDGQNIDKFILDIRYNSGGRGDLLIPFIHQFIKRDAINRPGHLYVLVGRKTFSAGVNLIGHLAVHTHALFVGEPAGAALNHYGDAQTYILPNSKLALQTSRLYHQMSRSDDSSRYIPIQIPAVFSASDYFSGRDPALAALLNTSPCAIPDLLWEAGREKAVNTYHEQLKKFGEIAWWMPFTESAMNTMGYRLMENTRLDDAIAAFTLNAERFPGSWNAWDSLAEAYLKSGNKGQAREFYARSLSIEPGNENARNALEQISITYTL